MILAVLVRRLKEGATYEEFRQAWFPDEPFGMPVRVINARRLDDEREILSVGFADLPADQVDAALKRLADHEARRHDRIAHVIESTVLRGIYNVEDDDHFS